MAVGAGHVRGGAAGGRPRGRRDLRGVRQAERVDDEKGIYKMRGSLPATGRPRRSRSSPRRRSTTRRGTERFRGCLDRRRDRSCKGDPSGTLRFTFDYWALFDGTGLARLGRVPAPGHRADGRLRRRAGRDRDGRHADAERRPHVLHRQPDAQGQGKSARRASAAASTAARAAGRLKPPGSGPGAPSAARPAAGLMPGPRSGRLGPRSPDGRPSIRSPRRSSGLPGRRS